MFNMIPVTSSQIAEVGYDDVAHKIRVEFANGSLYEYDGCTEEEFNALISAPSVGQEFANGIKVSKTFRRLG